MLFQSGCLKDFRELHTQSERDVSAWQDRKTNEHAELSKPNRVKCNINVIIV